MSTLSAAKTVAVANAKTVKAATATIYEYTSYPPHPVALTLNFSVFVIDKNPGAR